MLFNTNGKALKVNDDPTAMTNCRKTAFRASSWGNAVKHNLKASWIRREQTRVSNVTAMEHSPITTEQVFQLIAKTLNWKAPGPDRINNFWIKSFTATHSYLAHHFNQFMEDAETFQIF